MDDFLESYTLLRDYVKGGVKNQDLSKSLEEWYRTYLQILIQGMKVQNAEPVRAETERIQYIKSIYESYLKTEDASKYIAYLVGIITGEGKVGGAWLREQTDEDVFNQNMGILLSRAHIRDIIVSIYDTPGIQHKTLAAQAGIKANYLNQLASMLEKINCIRRYGTGKCTYYELTLRGKKYVQDMIGPKKDMERKRDFLKEMSEFKKIRNEVSYKTLRNRKNYFEEGKMEKKENNHDRNNVIRLDTYYASKITLEM